MDQKEESALRELYSSWSNERLILAVTHQRHEYQPEATAIALQALKTRGISFQAASEVAAGLPPPSQQGPTGPLKVIDSVARYLRRAFIGLVVVVAGFSGLILAEFATRILTGSENYYQSHSMPRLIGAVVGFIFSFTALKGLIWLWRWSTVANRTSPDSVIPLKNDRELVGRAYYTPYIFFLICTVVAFLDV